MSATSNVPAVLEPLNVTGPSGATYTIEPLRFFTGMTRVQMVDAYLHALVETGDRTDVDALLDARNLFAAETE
ncbi:MAG: hypothetical protein EKK42_20300 [Pseudonocardiaceae bacterium]|nr:MAG: hypothetical protein EKK42_20300 [Pseudonocardiaceae bacterium]